jgi:hypothetical protein
MLISIAIVNASRNHSRSDISRLIVRIDVQTPAVPVVVVDVQDQGAAML